MKNNILAAFVVGVFFLVGNSASVSAQLDFGNPGTLDLNSLERPSASQILQTPPPVDPKVNQSKENDDVVTFNSSDGEFTVSIDFGVLPNDPYFQALKRQQQRMSALSNPNITDAEMDNLIKDLESISSQIEDIQKQAFAKLGPDIFSKYANSTIEPDSELGLIAQERDEFIKFNNVLREYRDKLEPVVTYINNGLSDYYAYITLSTITFDKIPLELSTRGGGTGAIQGFVTDAEYNRPLEQQAERVFLMAANDLNQMKLDGLISQLEVIAITEEREPIGRFGFGPDNNLHWTVAQPDNPEDRLRSLF